MNEWNDWMNGKIAVYVTKWVWSSCRLDNRRICGEKLPMLLLLMNIGQMLLFNVQTARRFSLGHQLLNQLAFGFLLNGGHWLERAGQCARLGGILATPSGSNGGSLLGILAGERFATGQEGEVCKKAED